jgi:hypothetical protein
MFISANIFLKQKQASLRIHFRNKVSHLLMAKYNVSVGRYSSSRFGLYRSSCKLEMLTNIIMKTKLMDVQITSLSNVQVQSRYSLVDCETHSPSPLNRLCHQIARDNIIHSSDLYACLCVCDAGSATRIVDTAKTDSFHIDFRPAGSWLTHIRSMKRDFAWLPSK